MSDALDSARKFLESLQRFDLSRLLSECSIAILTSNGSLEDDDDWLPRVQGEIARAIAPTPIDEALRKLPDYDRKRVAEAIAYGYRNPNALTKLDVQTINHEVRGIPALVAELIIHREMMIDVATGGRRIQEADDYYRARQVRICERISSDAGYDNPHPDLWSWYRHWSQSLAQYKDRRHYIRQIFNPAIENVSKRSTIQLPEREFSGWERVDRALEKARAQLGRASAEEDFQGVGLLCREVIISLAQAVFDPAVHVIIDGVEASTTDANRMIEAFIAHEFPGSSFKEVRAHARASLALALNLQHRRTADRQLAALCLEAAASTVAVISIIARPV